MIFYTKVMEKFTSCNLQVGFIHVTKKHLFRLYILFEKTIKQVTNYTVYLLLFELNNFEFKNNYLN